MTNAPLAAGLRPCAESCPGVGWRRVLQRGLCPVRDRKAAGDGLKCCNPPSASSLPVVHDDMERVRIFSVHPVRYPQAEGVSQRFLTLKHPRLRGRRAKICDRQRLGGVIEVAGIQPDHSVRLRPGPNGIGTVGDSERTGTTLDGAGAGRRPTGWRVSENRVALSVKARAVVMFCRLESNTPPLGAVEKVKL